MPPVLNPQQEQFFRSSAGEKHGHYTWDLAALLRMQRGEQFHQVFESAPHWKIGEQGIYSPVPCKNPVCTLTNEAQAWEFGYFLATSQFFDAGTLSREEMGTLPPAGLGVERYEAETAVSIVTRVVEGCNTGLYTQRSSYRTHTIAWGVHYNQHIGRWLEGWIVWYHPKTGDRTPRLDQSFLQTEFALHKAYPGQHFVPRRVYLWADAAQEEQQGGSRWHVPEALRETALHAFYYGESHWRGFTIGDWLKDGQPFRRPEPLNHWNRTCDSEEDG